MIKRYIYLNHPSIILKISFCVNTTALYPVLLINLLNSELLSMILLQKVFFLDLYEIKHF